MPRPSPVRPADPVDWIIPKRPLGAHMSIAGGIDRALERGAAIGCTAIQIFTKSSNQWRARPLPDEEIARFRAAATSGTVGAVVAHDSYLINLCTPDDALYARSIDALVEELERCLRLGVPSLVTHPGCHMGQGAAFGVRRLAEAIDAAHARVPSPEVAIVLETMAGQGSAVGRTFEEIAAVLARVRDPARLGVCLDTCHVFAAGYDIRSASGYRETMRRFASEIGLPKLRAVHLNDSKTACGSQVDRHEHIGRGFLGLEAFRHLMNDPDLGRLPLVLETPKGEPDSGREDVENLAALMGLVARPTPGRGARAAAPVPATP